MRHLFTHLYHINGFIIGISGNLEYFIVVKEEKTESGSSENYFEEFISGVKYVGKSKMLVGSMMCAICVIDGKDFSSFIACKIGS